jgi:hypothetical protein
MLPFRNTLKVFETNLIELDESKDNKMRETLRVDIGITHFLAAEQVDVLNAQVER